MMQQVEMGIKQNNWLGGRRKTLRDIDPRMKILMSLAFSTMLLFTGQEMTILVAVIVAFIMLLLSGEGESGVKFLVVYAGSSFISFFIGFLGAESLRVLLGVFIYSCIKFIPIVMLGSWLMTTVKVNEFMVAMETIKIPRNVIIPLAVLLRFLPTVKEELNHIKDTMKMRNLELSVQGMVVHPMKSMEYILVPLLLRSVKVSDELSAAALTRGIDGENRRTSLRQVKILLFDLGLTSLFITMTAILWYLDQTVFANLVIGRGFL